MTGHDREGGSAKAGPLPQQSKPTYWWVFIQHGPCEYTPGDTEDVALANFARSHPAAVTHGTRVYVVAPDAARRVRIGYVDDEKAASS